MQLPSPLRLRCGAVQQCFQLNGVKGKIKNTGEKYNAWSIGSGYTYPLSKRTLVYGSINYGDGNKALSESSIDGYSCIFGMATSF